MSSSAAQPVGHLRYQRDLAGGEGDDALAELIKRIPSGARVLDVGCGPGTLGRFVSMRNGAMQDVAAQRLELVGIDVDPIALDFATAFYSQTHCVDLDDDKALDGFASASFDAIVCADVLEHTARPDLVLARLKRLLKPEGALLVSIPNVQYVGVILGLLRGEFVRSPAGILDDTHRHFFTRRSFSALLEQAGFAITLVKAIELDLEKSEFRCERPEAVARAAYELLEADLDAAAYQFVFVAHASSADDSTVAPVTRDGARPAGFFAEIFWRADDQPFASARRLRACGVLGETQALELTLAPQSAPIAELRYDPSNRPGFIHIEQLQIYGLDGALLWRWNGDAAALAAGALTDIAPIGAKRTGHYLARSSDPQIVLPVDAAARAKMAHGCRIVLEQSWPWSADFAAALERLSDLEKRLRLAEERAVAARADPNSRAQLLQLRRYLQTKQLEWMHERQASLQELEILHARLGSTAHVLAQRAVDALDRFAYLRRPIGKLARWVRERAR